MIRSLFIFSRAPRRDDPERISAPCEDDGDDATFRFTDRQPALLRVAVRAAKQARSEKNLDRIVEVDAMIAAIARFLFLVPLDRSNSRTRMSSLAMAMVPPNGGCDTSCIAENSLWRMRSRYDSHPIPGAKEHVG
jgi:hypothetical protein